MLENLPEIVFKYLTPDLLFWMSATVSVFYIVRGTLVKLRPGGMPTAMMFIYFARAVNWAMFAVAWLVFANYPIQVSRALLRVTFGFLVAFEIAYHGAYFSEYIISKLRKWKLKLSLR